MYAIADLKRHGKHIMKAGDSIVGILPAELVLNQCLSSVVEALHWWRKLPSLGLNVK